MTYTLDELFDMEMAQLKKEHGREPDERYWRWSPSDIRIWAGMLEVAHNHYVVTDSHSPGPVSLWEAGSGIGTKLYWAEHEYAIDAYGYELFDGYIEQARKLGVQCEKRDLSDMDNQPDWSIPDIVFTARPFKDEQFEDMWERYVQDHMHPGAVLISTFTAKKPYDWTCLYRATFRGVWVKPCDYGRATRNVQQKVTAK